MVYFCGYFMTKGERTKREIIEKTAPLFNTRGFEGTSLSALCEATSLTKGALYGNFESKEKLALAAFQFAIDKMRSYGREEVDPKKTYREKLLALLDFFSRYVLDPPVRGGCPLLNTAVEADDYRTSMKKVVAKELENSVSYLSGLMEDGKAAGEFRSDLKSREMAYFFFCAIEGAIMFSRVSSSEDAMKMVVKNIKSIVAEFCL